MLLLAIMLLLLLRLKRKMQIGGETAHLSESSHSWLWHYNTIYLSFCTKLWKLFSRDRLYDYSPQILLFAVNIACKLSRSNIRECFSSSKNINFVLFRSYFFHSELSFQSLRGHSQIWVFNLTLVFSSNHTLIGLHHKSIKYSTNESTVLLKNRVFDENTGVELKTHV